MIIRELKFTPSQFANYLNGIASFPFGAMVDVHQLVLAWLTAKLADEKLGREATPDEIYQTYEEIVKDKTNKELIELAKPYLTEQAKITLDSDQNKDRI
jgi:hypothetical protein